MQGLCLAEGCIKNGAGPQLLILTIDSLVPSVGEKSLSTIDVFRYR
jgi:hypothetical protein